MFNMRLKRYIAGKICLERGREGGRGGGGEGREGGGEEGGGGGEMRREGERVRR